MDAYLLAKAAEIEAIRAEIIGMVADNERRVMVGEYMSYTVDDFFCKAQDLKQISNDLIHYKTP